MREAPPSAVKNAADCFKDFGGHATSSEWLAKQEEMEAEKAAEEAAAEAKRAQRDEARAAKRDAAMALANKQFVRMRKLGFDEQKFAGDKEKPKLEEQKHSPPGCWRGRNGGL